jgi:hypothetical protein
VEAEDFSDGRVSGQYLVIHDGITQHITLHRDHTFEQDDVANGITRHASGTWRVFTSTGHMSFSSSFIDARGTWRGQDGQDVYAIFKNYFGLVSITFDPYTAPVKTYKKLFS